MKLLMKGCILYTSVNRRVSLCSDQLSPESKLALFEYWMDKKKYNELQEAHPVKGVLGGQTYIFPNSDAGSLMQSLG